MAAYADDVSRYEPLEWDWSFRTASAQLLYSTPSLKNPNASTGEQTEMQRVTRAFQRRDAPPP